jgi:site-specific recombinase XerD
MWRIISGLVADGASRGLIPAEASPHDLRHTFARRYLKEHAGDLVGLAQLLGHTDINTTAIYTRATAEDLASRVEQIELNAFAEAPRRRP